LAEQTLTNLEAHILKDTILLTVILGIVSCNIVHQYIYGNIGRTSGKWKRNEV